MSHHFHMCVEHSLQNTHIQWLSKSLRVTCKGVTVALLETVHITGRHSHCHCHNHIGHNLHAQWYLLLE